MVEVTVIEKRDVVIDINTEEALRTVCEAIIERLGQKIPDDMTPVGLNAHKTDNGFSVFIALEKVP